MKLNCFILRTTTVAGLGVPIFRVFTVKGKVIVAMGMYCILGSAYEKGSLFLRLDLPLALTIPD